MSNPMFPWHPLREGEILAASLKLIIDLQSSMDDGQGEWFDGWVLLDRVYSRLNNQWDKLKVTLTETMSTKVRTGYVRR